MRELIVDAGNDCDYTKALALGFDGAYFDVRDPRVTGAYLAEVERHGIGGHIFAAWNWPETGVSPPYIGDAKGAAFADWLDRELARVDGKAPDRPKVLVDIETHDVPFIQGFFRRWRQHRPLRVTDWTLEGFQGGLFSRVDVTVLAGRLIGFAPSSYTGSMQPLAADQVALDLVLAGFPPAKIRGMYDAAALPGRWSGYAFTQGRLP